VPAGIEDVPADAAVNVPVPLIALRRVVTPFTVVATFDEYVAPVAIVNAPVTVIAPVVPVTDN
jgi:hypothetical protein